MNDEMIYEQAFNLWKVNKDRIGNGFSFGHGLQAQLFMQNQNDIIDCIGLFLRIISKFNNVDYNPNWKEIDFSLYKFAPINFIERISFVVSRPTQYQSYMQLVGLFEELEKMFYKQLAIEKSQLN
ncbi:MAG: hypothetical protein K0R71_326 [Bacillales bacterium]|jgi:hypothetical protein|nr:hypothetical protein [Bacillales bacterium]